MRENVKFIEINKTEEVAKINPETVHCVYLGDDCVHFKAFALENDNIVCYEVSDEVKEVVMEDKLSEIFSFHPYEHHYLGMGHEVRMREEHYKPFKIRIKSAKFLGYRESFTILFDLMKNDNADLTDKAFAEIGMFVHRTTQIKPKNPKNPIMIMIMIQIMIQIQIYFYNHHHLYFLQEFI